MHTAQKEQRGLYRGSRFSDIESEPAIASARVNTNQIMGNLHIRAAAVSGNKEKLSGGRIYTSKKIEKYAMRNLTGLLNALICAKKAIVASRPSGKIEGEPRTATASTNETM